jgi:hypothetical protein
MFRPRNSGEEEGLQVAERDGLRCHLAVSGGRAGGDLQPICFNPVSEDSFRTVESSRTADSERPVFVQGGRLQENPAKPIVERSNYS